MSLGVRLLPYYCDLMGGSSVNVLIFSLSLTFLVSFLGTFFLISKLEDPLLHLFENIMALLC